MTDIDPADVPEQDSDLATVYDTPDTRDLRIRLRRLRELKTERMWDYICAQIDNQTNQTPATLAALAQARTQVTNLRDRIDALRAALRNAAP